MGYTDSPVFKMIPTHCTVCNRALVDGTSIEHGIGPVCRKKYGYEDAYDISDATAQVVIAMTKDFDDVNLKDGVMQAVLNDDSRKAVNILNRSLALWSKNLHENSKKISLALAAMREMGYQKLADIVSNRLADVKITIEEGRVILDTPYDPHFVQDVKSIPGRKWDGDNKVWSVPMSKKAEAWQAILKSYEGKLGTGPKGMFQITA